MQDSRIAFPALTLARSMVAYIAVTMLLIALGVAALLWARSDRLVDTALDQAVRVRTSAAGMAFARSIYNDWSDLTYLSHAAATADDATIRALMDGIRSDGSRVSWIGYANVTGKVLEASDGLLVGADVGQRPWFRNGLKRGFAGDVHEAVLLADALHPEGGEPPRFVDLALPVRSAQGGVIGVVGMHIDAAWVVQTLTETGHALGVDLYLVNSAGKVVMSTTGVRPAAEELALLRAARTGTQSAGRERWPDGQQYFSTLVPTIAYRDLPSFGWHLVGRLPASAFRPELMSLQKLVLDAVALALVIFAATTLFYVMVFLHPLAELAQSADRMAEGVDLYPPDSRTTREAAMLSSALARLQGGREAPPPVGRLAMRRAGG